jgi:hypothetical protein
MIHFFGILEPLAAKRQHSDEAPAKSAFFGPEDEAKAHGPSQAEAKRANIEETTSERQRFLLQSFAPQF